MKVLLINGSPRVHGNTYIALHEMEKIFTNLRIKTEFLHIGNKDIRGCIACASCAQNFLSPGSAIVRVYRYLEFCVRCIIPCGQKSPL